jgi:hypothetical protein
LGPPMPDSIRNMERFSRKNKGREFDFERER